MSTSQPKVAFAQRSEFRQALRQRVDSYFVSNNIRPNDNLAMYLKSAIIFGWVLGSWAFTLWGPSNVLFKILGCIALGLGLAGFGMSVGHDANHGSYSKNPLVNRFFSYTHEFIGVSSFLWRFRHNKLHHIYTNLQGLDVEVNGDGAVRMSPDEERKWHHQYQHYFIWFLYPLIPFYWFQGDLRRFIMSGDYLGHQIPKPKAGDIFDFIAPRIVSLAFFFLIPAWQGYSFLQIFVGLTISHMVYGFIVCSVFMLAHVVESVDYPAIDHSNNTVEDEWAILQVKTSADFAPDNAFLNWYLGGLNFQTIHHLFPDVCHIHYRQLAPIVAEVCAEHGVQYNVYDTLGSSVASHYRWLKRLGQVADADTPAAIA
ncbi:MAG: acyl-CoA desaturase [Thermosynechococcaceae cyanobacterium]